MQPNEAARAIPQSATRARAAINPRAFSGGALRNQSFANLAAARDPGARTLARSTFQGRFFDPQWRRRFSHPIVIGWVGPLFWPYAYSDFVDYTFYPYAYDTFWPYAYDDVYAGMFGPTRLAMAAPMHRSARAARTAVTLAAAPRVAAPPREKITADEASKPISAVGRPPG